MSARARWRDLRARVAPPYWQELARAVAPAESLLDVGCGSASPLGRVRGRVGRLVGVDAFTDAVEAARTGGSYDELHVHDVRRLDELFPPASFDVVAAVDLLEHLTCGEGDALLRAMERIARRRVVVFTPNGFVPQEARDENPWQIHRSGWDVAELQRRGYRVVGVHGLRPLRGREARIRLRPRRAWALVADLTQPLARRVPRLAYHLLATKELAP